MKYELITKKMDNITNIKKIFKIHPLVYFSALLFIGMGAYKEFIIISFLIIIHELGHIACAKIFGIKLDKIILYPLGGITKLQMDINEKALKEFLILIMGPIFQWIGYMILLRTSWDITLIKTYHFGILFFNLLPIYPLDGGKLIHIGINYLFPYKISLWISIYVSYLLTILLLFMNNNNSINGIILFIFLLVTTYKEDQKKELYFYKFLMERLLNNYSFFKRKKIKKIEQMYKYKENIFIETGEQWNEKEYLRKKYEKF